MLMGGKEKEAAYKDKKKIEESADLKYHNIVGSITKT